MCDGCTRREFGERQDQTIRQMSALSAQLRLWHPRRNRHLVQEIQRLHADSERDYAEHMTRDDEGRLIFRCPA